jgi:hypothetical protein
MQQQRDKIVHWRTRQMPNQLAETMPPKFQHVVRLRNPLILDGSVDGVERSLFEQLLPETLHEGSQALFRHHRD